MKTKNLLFACTIAGALFLSSCGSEDEPVVPVVPIELSVTSIPTITIDENPENGDELATLSGTVNRGDIVFSLSNQNPAGAMAVDATTGKLTVADASKFDFETNPTLTATANATVEGETKSTTITVNLNDLVEPDIDLVAFYQFNGNGTDEKGAKNAEIRGATPTTGVNGTANSAYTTGSGKYLAIDSSLVDIQKDFSIALWLKADNNSTDISQDVLNSRKDVKDGSEEGGIVLVYRKQPTFEQFVFFAFRTTNTVDQIVTKGINETLTRNQWYHVAIVKSGNTYSFYIDGDLNTSTTSSEVLDNGINWAIGANVTQSQGNPPSNEFNGAVDQLRFYNKAISKDVLDKLVADKI